jgi:hypothetical protein
LVLLTIRRFVPGALMALTRSRRERRRGRQDRKVPAGDAEAGVAAARRCSSARLVVVALMR